MSPRRLDLINFVKLFPRHLLPAGWTLLREQKLSLSWPACSGFTAENSVEWWISHKPAAGLSSIIFSVNSCYIRNDEAVRYRFVPPSLTFLVNGSEHSLQGSSRRSVDGKSLEKRQTDYLLTMKIDREKNSFASASLKVSFLFSSARFLAFQLIVLIFLLLFQLAVLLARQHDTSR